MYLWITALFIWSFLFWSALPYPFGKAYCDKDCSFNHITANPLFTFLCVCTLNQTPPLLLFWGSLSAVFSLYSYRHDKQRQGSEPLTHTVAENWHRGYWSFRTGWILVVWQTVSFVSQPGQKCQNSMRIKKHRKCIAAMSLSSHLITNFLHLKESKALFTMQSWGVATRFQGF